MMILLIISQRGQIILDGKKGVYPTIDDEAKANNIKSIRLDVFRKNIPAIKLYESFRYEYLDTIDEGYSMYGLDLFRIYEKIIK